MSNKLFKTVAVALGVPTVAALSVLIGFWFFAPPVGGEFWPYIRLIGSVMSAMFTFSITYVVTSWVLAIRMANSVKQELWENGSEENPFDDEEVESFMENLQDNNK